MTARDIQWGRRGGRWANADTGTLREQLAAIRAQHQAAGTWPAFIDRDRLFHPDTIATSRAHDRYCTHKADEPCDATPDPDDLAALWAGRARMATARATAGLALSPLDTEALTLAEQVSA